MKTLFIPLDERPCNYIFPQLLVTHKTDVHICIPPIELLGHKKSPADTKKLSEFLISHVKDCDNLVLSIDMLLYGGLIPSRLHHLSEKEVNERLDIVHQIKNINPHIKIYAFHCIMRAPSYNSSEEEPDYYEDFGYALFRRKYLLDYQKRHGLSQEELLELKSIHIPRDIIDDYEWRRDFNTQMNLKVIDYLKNGDIDFLVIPQDDSSPYGYTSLSQKKVVDEVKKSHLEQQVMIYPGADEVSMSLFIRAYHEYYHLEPKVYPFYASVLGPTIVPKYEDRPMFESLKSHIRVCRAKMVDTPQEADLILAINSPGKIMQESFVDEVEKDISYTSYRNLLDFAYKIKDYLQEGYQVALCDSAYSNGGDYQLIEYLDHLNILDQLISYAGWNTNCNSLGTTLAQSFFGRNQKHLCYRIIEDVFYQTIVRKQIIDCDLIELGLSYYDFKDQQDIVENRILNQLQAYYDSLNMSHHYPVHIQRIWMPWKRMFEIGMEIEV